MTLSGTETLANHTSTRRMSSQQNETAKTHSTSPEDNVQYAVWLLTIIVSNRTVAIAVEEKYEDLVVIEKYKTEPYGPCSRTAMTTRVPAVEARIPGNPSWDRTHR